MLSLPTELYRPIVDLITDQPTIYALLFVSSVLNYEAERALYRSISPRGVKTQKKLFQKLHSCKRVAKLVFGLDIVLDKYVEIKYALYWSSLSLALRALINLKSFGFAITWNVDGMAHILDGCLFQLESFSWHFQSEERLSHFLENQPRIRTLDLQGAFSPYHLSSNALPQLSTLTGHINGINSLLPERNTTHLSWNPVFLDDEPDLASIGPALNNIRVLKYGGLPSAPPLHIIVNYLGKLEVLQWNRLNFSEIIDSGPLLPRLQKIILPCRPRANPETFHERLFARIHTLQLVDIAGHKSNTAFRWSRGSDVPQPIVIRHDDWIFC